LMILSWVTAYHSFSGEVEASNTPTIRRLTPSRRHQLPRIAQSAMPSRIATQFDDELFGLFQARTHALRASIWPSPGPGVHITKQKVRRAIKRLTSLSEAALLRSKHVRRLLKNFDYRKQWHVTKSKGHGRDAKRRNFKQWYERKITTRNCVYALWNGKRCLYVGRTLNGKGRPTHHFDRHWFGAVSRVDVFAFDRKRGVPRFECLFTHRHEPSYSTIRPASKKYYLRCPICENSKEIRREVKALFRLR